MLCAPLVRMAWILLLITPLSQALEIWKPTPFPVVLVSSTPALDTNRNLQYGMPPFADIQSANCDNLKGMLKRKTAGNAESWEYVTTVAKKHYRDMESQPTSVKSKMDLGMVTWYCTETATKNIMDQKWDLYSQNSDIAPGNHNCNRHWYSTLQHTTGRRVYTQYCDLERPVQKEHPNLDKWTCIPGRVAVKVKPYMVCEALSRSWYILSHKCKNDNIKGPILLGPNYEFSKSCSKDCNEHYITRDGSKQAQLVGNQEDIASPWCQKTMCNSCEECSTAVPCQCVLDCPSMTVKPPIGGTTSESPTVGTTDPPIEPPDVRTTKYSTKIIRPVITKPPTPAPTFGSTKSKMEALVENMGHISTVVSTGIEIFTQVRNVIGDTIMWAMDIIDEIRYFEAPPHDDSGGTCYTCQKDVGAADTVKEKMCINLDGGNTEKNNISGLMGVGTWTRQSDAKTLLWKCQTGFTQDKESCPEYECHKTNGVRPTASGCHHPNCLIDNCPPLEDSSDGGRKNSKIIQVQKQMNNPQLFKPAFGRKPDIVQFECVEGYSIPPGLSQFAVCYQEQVSGKVQWNYLYVDPNTNEQSLGVSLRIPTCKKVECSSPSVLFARSPLKHKMIISGGGTNLHSTFTVTCPKGHKFDLDGVQYLKSEDKTESLIKDYDGIIEELTGRCEEREILGAEESEEVDGFWFMEAVGFRIAGLRKLRCVPSAKCSTKVRTSFTNSSVLVQYIQPDGLAVDKCSAVGCRIAYFCPEPLEPEEAGVRFAICEHVEENPKWYYIKGNGRKEDSMMVNPRCKQNCWLQKFAKTASVTWLISGRGKNVKDYLVNAVKTAMEYWRDIIKQKKQLQTRCFVALVECDAKKDGILFQELNDKVDAKYNNWDCEYLYQLFGDSNDKITNLFYTLDYEVKNKKELFFGFRDAIKEARRRRLSIKDEDQMLTANEEGFIIISGETPAIIRKIYKKELTLTDVMLSITQNNNIQRIRRVASEYELAEKPMELLIRILKDAGKDDTSANNYAKPAAELVDTIYQTQEDSQGGAAFIIQTSGEEEAKWQFAAKLIRRYKNTKTINNRCYMVRCPPYLELLNASMKIAIANAITGLLEEYTANFTNLADLKPMERREVMIEFKKELIQNADDGIRKVERDSSENWRSRFEYTYMRRTSLSKARKRRELHPEEPHPVTRAFNWFTYTTKSQANKVLTQNLYNYNKVCANMENKLYGDEKILG